MKLNKSQIEFIDNYLQKSDVYFVDIRAELTDHVASAVEEKMLVEGLEFYDAFKTFMVVNKKELLKPKNYFVSAVVNFVKTLNKPYSLITGVLILISNALVFQHSDSAKIFEQICYVSFAYLVLLAIAQFIYTAMILKKRFIQLENLSFILTAIYWLSILANGFFSDYRGNMLTSAAVMYVLIVYSIYSFQIIKKFNKRKLYL